MGQGASCKMSYRAFTSHFSYQRRPSRSRFISGIESPTSNTKFVQYQILNFTIIPQQNHPPAKPRTNQTLPPAMAYDDGRQTAVIIGTSIATFIGGFILGVWAIQGYIISPALVEERRRFYNDPVESEESDVEEEDTILDHAPNWANGAQADRKQGLSAAGAAAATRSSISEECKLVLVVRTDLGMTKGKKRRRKNLKQLPSPRQETRC